MKTLKSKLLISALLLVSAALPANANTVNFDFYKLGKGVANGDFLPTDGIASEGGDLSSSDVNNGIFNGDLNFTNGGLTATATGTYLGDDAAVVQDKESGWTADRTKGAGLGVYHSPPNTNDDFYDSRLDTSDDNITSGEILTIKFNQMVNLTQIGLNSDGHNIFGQTSTYNFLFNGVDYDLIGTTNLSVIGDTFTFAFSTNSGKQFYLSSLTVSAVPESGSSIALIGAALMGLAALRRKFGQG